MVLSHTHNTKFHKSHEIKKQALVYPQENESIIIESLSKLSGYKVKSVNQLGSINSLQWKQTKTGLRISGVQRTTSGLGYTLKIDID